MIVPRWRRPIGDIRRSVAAFAGAVVLVSAVVPDAVAAGPADVPGDVSGDQRPAAEVSSPQVHDRVLVRWEDGTTATDRRRALAAHVPELIGDPVPVTEQLDLLVVGRERAVAVAERLPAVREVALAEVDQVLSDRAPAAQLDEILAPSDPLFRQQWGLANTGQSLSLSSGFVLASEGIDIRLLPAWATTRGRQDVVVAVIDTAVDDTHPDLLGSLAGQLATSPEAAASSRFHGTAVASVIAARADDGVGMVGVAPEISVLSIGAFSSTGDGPGSSTLSDVLAAFELARIEGADVINASWVTPEDSPLLFEAVAEAGVPVVAASGNEGLTDTARSVYPAGYSLPNLVTVTAVDPSGAVPGFANVGRDVVDVGAPGRLVIAAVPGGGYSYVDGTSFAAPHVAGAIALASSVAPYSSPADLIDAVSWTSRVEPALVGVTRTGGMLDVAALVHGIQRPMCRPDLLPPADFPDVARTNAHIAGIDCIVMTGLTSGRADGTYAPDEMVTREQMASFLAGIVDDVLGLPAAPSAGFVDVDPDSPHAPAIDRLVQLGIARGTGDDTFRPRDPVTRGQLATFLVGTHDVLTGVPVPPTRRWFDDTDTSTHAAAIDRARDLGLIRGVDRVRFEPAVPTRRDQMASLLAKTLDALVRSGVVAGGVDAG